MKSVLLSLLLISSTAFALPLGNWKEVCFADKGECIFTFEGSGHKMLFLPEALYNSSASTRNEMSGDKIEIKLLTPSLHTELVAKNVPTVTQNVYEETLLITPMSPEASSALSNGAACTGMAIACGGAAFITPLGSFAAVFLMKVGCAAAGVQCAIAYDSYSAWKQAQRKIKAIEEEQAKQNGGASGANPHPSGGPGGFPQTGGPSGGGPCTIGAPGITRMPNPPGTSGPVIEIHAPFRLTPCPGTQ